MAGLSTYFAGVFGRALHRAEYRVTRQTIPDPSLRFSMTPLLRTEIPGRPVRRGKVRDVYDFGDYLLLVATDRISAFDWVLPSGIPDKGRVLTQLSGFWFELLGTPHHLLSLAVDPARLPDGVDAAPLAGRSMIVRKAEVVPIECVVRG